MEKLISISSNEACWPNVVRHFMKNYAAMKKSDLDYPTTIEIKSIDKLNGNKPVIEDLHYDLYTLKVRLNFSTNTEYLEPIYVIFRQVEGFRVLGEENLMEFWVNPKRANGWLWKVENGGWHDQEKKRDGFINEITEDFDEYMIVGQNDCLNVITGFEPTFIY